MILFFLFCFRLLFFFRTRFVSVYFLEEKEKMPQRSTFVVISYWLCWGLPEAAVSAVPVQR